MKELLMRLIHYRGEYVVLGQNQAMKMLLSEDEPVSNLGPTLRSFGFAIPAGAVVTGIRVKVDSSHVHRIEAPEQAHTVPIDAQIASVSR